MQLLKDLDIRAAMRDDSHMSASDHLGPQFKNDDGVSYRPFSESRSEHHDDGVSYRSFSSYDNEDYDDGVSYRPASDGHYDEDD